MSQLPTVLDSSSDEEEEIVLQPGVLSSSTQPTITMPASLVTPPLAQPTQEPFDIAAHLNKLALSNASPTRILVILDLNGFLFYREFIKNNKGRSPMKQRHGAGPKGKTNAHGPKHNTNANAPQNNTNVKPVKLGNFNVWNRPHMKEFLVFLFDNFDVAVWSSAASHNVKALLEYALTREQVARLQFVWHNDKCTDAGKHPLHDHKNLYMKEIAKVWAAFPDRYSSNNTLLIDDSKFKVQRNLKHTSIHPLEWTKDDPKDNALGKGGFIREFLQGLIEQTKAQGGQPNVPEFVKSNPWPQAHPHDEHLEG